MPFSKKAFKGLVSHARREISTAKYKIGTTNYLATINSIEEKDSELVIYLQFNPDVKMKLLYQKYPYTIHQENCFITKQRTSNLTL